MVAIPWRLKQLDSSLRMGKKQKDTTYQHDTTIFQAVMAYCTYLHIWEEVLNTWSLHGYLQLNVKGVSCLFRAITLPTFACF
jgi:hypothetical protein